MQIIEIGLIAIGLSFDTFAVSVSAGLTHQTIKFWQAIKIALIFGLFHALMPLLGWLGGSHIEVFILQADHWVAFILLSVIGTKMLFDSFKKDNDEEEEFNPMRFPVLIGAGIATSIDALVIGITFAFIELNIYQAIAIIGATTFLAAMFGMLLGKQASGKYGKKFEILGGLILIGIGLKILIEHLN